jgi:hypothetical protein
VGVCLVLALIKIRSFVNKRGGALGPIVALSYKNHALDEFLLDALHAQPELKKMGSLVRLGKSDHEELAGFTEKSSKYESEARKKLEERLETIKSAKNEILSMQSVMMGGADPSENIIKCIFSCVRTYDMLFTQCEGEYNGKSVFLILKDLVAMMQEKPTELWTMVTEELRENAMLDENKTFPILSSSDHWLIDKNKGTHSFPRFQAVFLKYLQGEMVPPRCAGLVVSKNGNSKRCRNCVVVENSQYCNELHRCSFNIGEECMEERADRSVFCATHTCHAANCVAKVVFGAQFCSTHSCPICLLFKRENDSACATHRCAVVTKEGIHCQGALVDGLSYCRDHICNHCVEAGCVSMSSRSDTDQCCVAHKCNVDYCIKLKEKTNGSDFCLEHGCLICGDMVAGYGEQYCETHKCVDTDCSECKVSLVNQPYGMIDFCEDHACRVCAQHGLKEIGYGFNHGTCDLHPFCLAIGGDGQACGVIVAIDEQFCSLHKMQNVSTCQAIAKSSNRPCKQSPIPGNIFCKNHLGAHVVTKDSLQPKNALNIHSLFEANLFAKLPKTVNRSNSSSSATAGLGSRATAFSQPSGTIIVKCIGKNCNIWSVCKSDNAWLCNVHCVKQTKVVPPKEAPREAKILDKSCTTKFPVVASSESQRKVALPDSKVSATEMKQPDLLTQGNQGNIAPPESGNVFDEEYEGDKNIDEMEYREEDVGDVEEEEENVQALHNQDIYQEESDDEESDRHEMDEESANLDNEEDEYDWNQLSLDEMSDFIFDEVLEFLQCDWSYSASDRLRCVHRFVSFTTQLLKLLLPLATPFIDDARRAKAEANGMILKKATLIGGTVVGAVKRLPALRAAEPFAVIVEEACEVMEPTLISVLAVESLQKLELIGDHRQLPAFVNQNWYNIASVKPKLKKSLFERIVLGVGSSSAADGMKERSSAYAQHPICTILDVQRRMRSSISELTKHEYADIVKLKDHESTGQQCIGDRLLKNKTEFPKPVIARLESFRQSWTGGGRSVPGIKPNVFFWDLEGNSESKAKVGMSACNEHEAHAIVQLVKYLHNVNGVPLESITIITPYQGQKRVLVEMLRKEHVLPKWSNTMQPATGGGQKGNNGGPQQKEASASTPAVQSLIVSTVDRYQGDENDIVILSLVRVRSGNMFVALLNRFIVAASRARLGFYIVGSKSAVLSESSKANHWNKCFARLEGTANLEVSKPDDEHDGFNESRIGPLLPICCSQHRHRSKYIPSNEDLICFPTGTTWNRDMCKEACEHKLRCLHNCALPCHSYEPTKHENHCKRLWKRPCKEHEETNIVCGDIRIEGEESFSQAFDKRWKCDLPLTIEYPKCIHNLTGKCYEMKDIEKGKVAWPSCMEKVEDYELPCGHVIKAPKCWERQTYMEGQLPLCCEKVNMMKTCGEHHEILQCHKVEIEKANPTLCKQIKSISRPRCSHRFTLPCCDAAQLMTQWQRKLCEGTSQPMIEEGKDYGPSEELILPGRGIQPCTAKIMVKRHCGHVLEGVNCRDAFQMIRDDTLPVCKEKVVTKCPFCVTNCEYQVPCHLLDAFEQWSVKNVLASHRSSNGLIDILFLEHVTFEADLELWRYLLLQPCTSAVNLQRTCSHVVKIPCRDIVRLMAGKWKLPECKEMIVRTLTQCGHEVESLCHNRNKAEPVCIEPTGEKVTLACQHLRIPKHCGDYHQLRKQNASGKLLCQETARGVIIAPCRHAVDVLCCKVQEISKIASGSQFVVNNVVQHGIPYCLPCGYELHVNCKEIVQYQRACGHLDPNGVACSTAVKLALDLEQDTSQCNVSVPFQLPQCHHEVSLSCSQLQLQQGSGRSDLEILQAIPCGHKQIYTCSLEHETTYPCSQAFAWSQEDINRACTKQVSKKCTACNVNYCTVECKDTVVHCRGMVTIQLEQCGHSCTWDCTSGNDPRHSYDAERGVYLNCRDCVLNLWEQEREIEITAEALQTYLDQALTTYCTKNNIAIDANQQQTVALSSMDPYERVRVDTINRYCKWLSNTNLSPQHKPWVLPPHRKDKSSVQEYIAQNYKLVFLKTTLEDAAKMQITSRKFVSSNTPYGMGLEVKEFTREQLMRLASEGELTLSVGLGFLLNPLLDEPVFLHNQQVQQKDVPGNKKAQQTRDQWLNQGYDGAILEGGKSTSICVFWYHHAVVPLRIIQVTLHKTCLLCFENLPDDPKSGCMCPRKHFVCWGEDCMSAYIDAASQSDEGSNYLTQGGTLMCPHADCKKDKIAFDYQRLSAHCPPELYAALNALQIKVCSDQKVAAAVAAEGERHQRELEEFKQMDELTREVSLLKKTIENDILIPRCPNKHPFHEFSNCFALTCTYDNCRANFCAWCEEDCGEDAHRHVATCRHGTGNVYGDNDPKRAKKLLEEARNRIRTGKILRLLETKSPEVRKKVVDALKKTFEDINLVLKSK